MTFSCETINQFIKNITVFIKWILISIIVGCLIGLSGTLFHYSIYYATELRMNHEWITYLLPLGGIAIVFLYKTADMEDMGTDLIIQSVRSEKRPPFKMAPLIFISTTITHLFGGSAGREGAALQLGGSLAYALGHKLHLSEKDINIIIMCGMSAAFSALFRTPLTSAIFSIEVISVGIMHYSALVPCTFSSVIAYMLSGFFKVPASSFAISGIPDLTVPYIIKVSILAILCAGISMLFCHAMHFASALYKRFFKNSYIRIIAGSILVILLTFLIDSKSYLGAGTDIISNAMSGTVPAFSFLLKLIFTALTLGCGFKGGEIVPSFFVGACFGNMASQFLGLSPSFGAAIGLVCVFCGVTNCPITSFILSLELFNCNGIIFFIIASSISYMLSGYHGLYKTQKIVYSKIQPKFIDKLSI